MKKFIFLLLLTVGVISAQPSQPVFRRGASLPTVCATGDVFYKTAATAGQYNCIATNTWAIVTGSGGAGTVTDVTGTASEITVANGTTTPALSLAAAFDISGHTSTAPIKKGTTLPATCTIGQFYDKTDTTPGQNLFSCTSTNAWTVITGSATPADPVNSIQFNNAGAFGGNSAYIINLSTITDFPDAINFTGPAMASSAGATGYGAGTFRITTGIGGDTTIASTGTGGQGGDIVFTTSTGGGANNALTASTGGGAGSFTFVSSDGSSSNVTGVGTNTGGYGGGAFFQLGNGGGAGNGSVNNGGNGGSFEIILGSGGVGTTANGMNGSFLVDGSSSPVFTVQYDGSVLAVSLKTTGAATGKKVVCVDTTTGKLYASSTGTDCSN